MSVIVSWESQAKCRLNFYLVIRWIPYFKHIFLPDRFWRFFCSKLRKKRTNEMIMFYDWIDHNFYFSLCFYWNNFCFQCVTIISSCPFSTWIWNTVLEQDQLDMIILFFFLSERICSKQMFSKKLKELIYIHLTNAGICFTHMTLMAFKWNTRPLIQQRNKLI